MNTNRRTGRGKKILGQGKEGEKKKSFAQKTFLVPLVTCHSCQKKLEEIACEGSYSLLGSDPEGQGNKKYLMGWSVALAPVE